MKSTGRGKGQHEAEEGGIVVVEVPEEHAAIPSPSEHHRDRPRHTDNHNNNRINPDFPPYSLNPRWRGYCLIALFSIICLGSVRHVKSNINSEKNEMMKNSFDGNPRVGIAFGSLSLGISCFVLLHEYIQRCISQFEQRGVDTGFHDAQAFDFKVLLGGKVEGSVLALLVILWSIGLGYLTQVNGIAYAGSMNVYWSAWLSFATCLYTFFNWIKATNVEWKKPPTTTTKSASCWRHIMFPTWCILALSSLVVMGTSSEMLATQRDSIMIHDDQYEAEAAYAISWGLLSFLVCVLWIGLVDRDNRGDSGNGSPRPKTTLAAAAATAAPNSRQKWSKREWMELILILMCLLFWIVATALFTRPEGLGATIMGQHIVTNSGTAEQDASLPDNVFTTDMFYKVPGSNLYLGVWTCFGASLYLLNQWSMEPHQQPPAAAEPRPQPQQEQRALPQQHPVGQKKRQQPQHQQRGRGPPPPGQEQQQQQRRRSPQPRQEQQQQRRPPTSGNEQQQRKRRPPPPAGERQQQQRPKRTAKATRIGQVEHDESQDPNEHGHPQPPPNNNDQSMPASLGGGSDLENDDVFVDAQED